MSRPIGGQEDYCALPALSASASRRARPADEVFLFLLQRLAEGPAEAKYHSTNLPRAFRDLVKARISGRGVFA